MAQSQQPGSVWVASPGVARVARRRVARLGEASAVAKLASLGLLGVAVVNPLQLWEWLIGAAVLAGGLSMTVTAHARRLGTAEWKPGGIEAQADTLWVTHGTTRVAVPRAEVARAELIETPDVGRWALVIYTVAGDLLHLALGSREAGAYFLQQTGLDRTPAAEQLRFVSPMRQFFNVTLLWSLAMCFAVPILALGMWFAWEIVKPGSTPLAFAAMGALAVFFLGWVTARSVNASWTPTLTVGAEGFQVGKPWKTQFYPYQQLTNITVWPSEAGSSLRLTVAQGTTHSFMSSGPYVREPERAAALLNVRLRALRQRSVVAHEALARQGRSVEAWRAAVGHLLGRGTAFRDGSLGRDALLDRVEVASLPAEQRLGAALALMDADDDARTRVRIAAEACADTPLREALEAALAGRLDDTLVARIDPGTAPPTAAQGSGSEG